jgi:alpha-amylase
VGSSLELGAWDPRHAVPLEGSNNRRSSVIQLPAQQQVEWKCMVRRQDSPEIRWQPGPNVSFTSGTANETTGRL